MEILGETSLFISQLSSETNAHPDMGLRDMKQSLN